MTPFNEKEVAEKFMASYYCPHVTDIRTCYPKKECVLCIANLVTTAYQAGARARQEMDNNAEGADMSRIDEIESRLTSPEYYGIGSLDASWLCKQLRAAMKVVEVTRDYMDYLDSGNLKSYGSELRRNNIKQALSAYNQAGNNDKNT